MNEKDMKMVVACSDYVKNQARFITLRDTGEMYRWAESIWRNGGETEIKEIIEHSPYIVNRNIIGEVIDKVKRQTYIDRDKLDNNKSIVSVINGAVDFSTGDLIDNNPDLFNTIQLPITYDSSKTCNVIKKFINESMGTYSNLFYEMLAYCLIPDYRFKKFFIIVGETGTGKTTAVNLMQEFLGRCNVSHITLQNLADNRFSLANVYGKLANISDDLPKVGFDDVGHIKQLTGNSNISAESKYIQEPVSFVNRAKLIFTCNSVPKSKGLDNAFYDRLIIIPFGFQPEEKNESLIDEMITPDELSGLLNVVIAARQSMIDNNGFSISQDINTVMDMYSINTDDSVSQFNHYMINKDVNGIVLKEKLYQEYTNFCASSSMVAKANNAFHRKIQELGHNDLSFISVGDGQKWAYKGISLKKEGVSCK